MGIRLALGAALLVLAGCEGVLRTHGSSPEVVRPVLEPVWLPTHEYRVWVVVPEITVYTYPMRDKTQQPLLQFTGDQARFNHGAGQLAVLAAPDVYHDGERVTYFEDKVLWSDRLRENDRRVFTLWLRENNRSAPTRIDEQLHQLERVVGVIEEVAGMAGFKIPARRAVNVTAEALRELQQDWLILRWSCPWSHVLDAARAALARAPERQNVVLRTVLVSRERVHSRPAAEVTVLFAVERRKAEVP